MLKLLGKMFEKIATFPWGLFKIFLLGLAGGGLIPSHPVAGVALALLSVVQVFENALQKISPKYSETAAPH